MKRYSFLGWIMTVCLFLQLFGVSAHAGKPINLGKLKYDDGRDFNGGIASVRGFFEDNLYGLIDKTGKELARGYDEIGEYREGLIPVRKGKNWSYLDKTGKEVIKIGKRYDWVEYFSEGYAMVRKGEEGKEKYGFIDKKGKEVIGLKYDRVYDFSGKLAQAEKDGKWGLIDKKGKEVVPIKYDNVGPLMEGMVAVKEGKKWGFMNQNGNWAVKPKYDGVYDFSEGLASVKIGKKWGIINKKGKEVLKPKYDEIWSCKEGRISFKKGQKWGSMDKSFNEIIKPKYDAVYLSVNGLSVFQSKNKYGYLDSKTGKVVIPAKYFAAGVCGEDVCVAVKNVEDEETFRNVVPAEFCTGSFVVMDKKGKVLFEGTYSDIFDFSEGLAFAAKQVKKGKKLERTIGYLDKKGEFKIILKKYTIDADAVY